MLFTGGLILTALEMSLGFGGDFISGSYGWGLMASWAQELYRCEETYLGKSRT